MKLIFNQFTLLFFYSTCNLFQVNKIEITHHAYISLDQFNLIG